jgi:hypothetical protein
LNRVDAMVAGQELRGLVQVNLVDQQGASRWTSYTLKAAREYIELVARPRKTKLWRTCGSIALSIIPNAVSCSGSMKHRRITC